MEQFHGTTILSVRRQTPEGVQVAIGGDGQVTLGNIVIKGTARKVRKLYHGKVLAGFAGATADAFTLFERFEAKLEKHQGHLTRAAIELTKDWRTDRVLRKLEAMLAVADHSASLIITGNGDVLEPEQGIVAIGSGGAYAQAAARGNPGLQDLLAGGVDVVYPRRNQGLYEDVAAAGAILSENPPGTPTRSVPAGNSVSLCQTRTTSAPACANATARSRSQFDPGKVMTAAFMARLRF